jgi:ATP-binding cassette subfamily C (CFTR/MRP) protein 1
VLHLYVHVLALTTGAGSNLDPFDQYDDARLWDALRRSYLVDADAAGTVGPGSEKVASGASTPKTRFTLDTVVDAEGANLSQGERSLLSIARALVKDSRIVILDEVRV